MISQITPIRRARLAARVSVILTACCSLLVACFAPSIASAEIHLIGAQPAVTPAPGQHHSAVQRAIDIAKPAGTSTPDSNITVRAYTGEQDPNASEGSTFLRFFTPEVGAYLAALRSGGPGGTELKIGGLLDNFPGAVVSNLAQPCGNCVLATFKPGVGGIKSFDNVALLDGDLQDNDENAVVMTGTNQTNLPPGVVIKRILTIDGNGDDPFFFALLSGSGVNSHNSLALCSVTPGQNYVRILLRVGDSVNVSGSSNKTVKAITTLVGALGSISQGRWRCDYFPFEEEEISSRTPALIPDPIEAAGLDWIGVLLYFTDGTQELVAIPYDAFSYNDWVDLIGTGYSGFISGLENTQITSFGLPCYNGTAYYAVIVNLATDQTQDGPAKAVKTVGEQTPSVTSSNNSAIITAYGAFSEPTLVVRKGDPVTTDPAGHTLTGVTVAGFDNPVVSGGGNVAFIVTLKGMVANQNQGIMLYNGNTTSLIANIGYAAPGGGFWSSFSNIEYCACEANGGFYFTGTLATSGSDGINSSNNYGLWGMNDEDEISLLLRTGQTVTVNNTPKIVKSFIALAAAPGSVGAAHGYDDTGDIDVVATFTDGSKALLNIYLSDVGNIDN